MKKIIITLSFLALCMVAFAQKTETELVRSAFRLDKKAVVAEFLQLSDADAGKFWPIYEKYEQERVASVGDRRLQLIENYANKYETMDDASADKMVSESAIIQKKEIAVREKYYGMVKKSVGIGIAARFYQIEDVISVATRMQLYNAMPLLQKK
jgi:hypothetical protein